MRYASTYGLESLVLAHQHETFAFQKKRQRTHGICENFILKKKLKKTRTSFCFFYQFWEQIHKDMKLLYGLVVILTKYFPLFLPNIIIPTFTSPHNSIWSTGEQISGSNMTYQIFWFKHAFCLLFLLIREEKVVMMMLGSKSGKYFWNCNISI